MNIKHYLSFCTVIILLFLVFTVLFGITFGIIFVTANILLTASLYYSYPRRKIRILRYIHNAVLLGYSVFLLSFAAVQILLVLEMDTEVPSDIDYAVILGAGLKGEEISRTLETRLKAGAEYLIDHPGVPVIVSGGQGKGEDIPESKAMAGYLISHGINPDRITEENQSTTTFENLENSKRILERNGSADGHILIITSDYHVYRAKLTGEKLGLHCSGLSGESDFFIQVNYMIREYFAVVKTVILS
ncbi:YdcF family protein [Bacillus salacetis]|uniref:YdcF family protein n=1 Tax=Bacillus salacetis TaxID=2315464 RepID=A0A3A1R1A8_9BACI|nr:YdcF family protein [Bacillus salacetis]RIW35328.1 YdcF family protein [Bacillus salacetis]